MHAHFSGIRSAPQSRTVFSLTTFMRSQHAVHFVAGDKPAVDQSIGDWRASAVCRLEMLSAKKQVNASAVLQAMQTIIAANRGTDGEESMCFVIDDSEQLSLECILKIFDECHDQSFKVIFLLPSCGGESLGVLSQKESLVSIVKLPDIRKTISVIQEALQKKNFSRYEKAYPLGLPPLTTIYNIHHASQGDEALIQRQISDWMKSDPFITTFNGRQGSSMTGRIWDSRLLHQGVGLAVVAGMSFGLWQQQKDDVLLAQNSQPHVVALSAQRSRVVSGQRFASHAPASAKVYTIAVTRSRSPQQLRRLERRMHIPVKSVTLRKVALADHKRTYEMDVGRYASRQAAETALQRMQSHTSSGFA